jgi:transcriptional regulator with XRE-family HTH domain
MSKTENKYPNKMPYYRARLGFTQEQLAYIVGYRNLRWIRRIESGEVIPGSLMMLRLATALRVPVDFLYADTLNILRVKVRATEERMPKGQQGVLQLSI